MKRSARPADRLSLRFRSLRVYWTVPSLLILLSGVPSGAATEDEPVPGMFGGSDELWQRLATIQSERRELQLRTAERGRAYVRLVRLGLLPMSDGFDGLVRHAQRVTMLDRLLTRDLVRARELAQQSSALEALLAEMKDRAPESLAQLTSYSRSKEAILAAKEREAAFARAFQSNWKPSGNRTIYSSVAPPAPGFSLVSLQGRLSFPVEGRAQVQEVAANAEFGPGLQFQVDTSSKPRSVFRGRVVLVGDYGSLGHAVVIDHGDGYSTLTANLEIVQVEAGQQLPAGFPLGELRGKGEARELYFELRRGGVAISAAEWFGL